MESFPNYNLKEGIFVHRNYILAISMSNPTIYGGGTNSAVINYQRLYNENNLGYISISPYILRGRKLKIFNTKWSVVIDGKQLGVFDTTELNNLLSKLHDCGCEMLEIHFHHGMNLDFQELNRILERHDANIIFFVHDFYSICVNFTMRDEKGEYCGNSGINKQKCRNCGFFCKAKSNAEKYAEIWEKYKKRIMIVFPSEVAKRVWLSAYNGFEEKSVIVPHQKWVGQYELNKEVNIPFRIAFVGACEEYKGWEVFQKVFSELKYNKLFEWYYFGKSEVNIKGINTVFVDNRSEETSMINCLRAYNIDAAIMWSLCQETYSFTYHECTASNVYIITGRKSGNIAEQIVLNGNGVVLNSEEELRFFFENRFESEVERFKRNGFYGPMKLEFNNILVNNSSLNTVKTDQDINYKFSGNNLFNRVLSIVDILIEKAQIQKRNMKIYRSKKRNKLDEG